MPLIEQTLEAPFYIPATGPATRPRRTLKCGDCFAVLDSHGDMGASPGGPDGMFFRDTRFLGRLELLLEGSQLLLLGSSVRDDNALLTVDLTNADIYLERRLVLPKDTLHVVRTIFLWHSTAYERLRVQNHGEQTVNVQLSLSFSSDFADLFEVRGVRRARRGVGSASVVSPSCVVLKYKGLDKTLRHTRLTFEPTPSRTTTRSVVYRLSIEPGKSGSIYVMAECQHNGDATHPGSFRDSMRLALRQRRADNTGFATVRTSNEILNEVFCRSMSDLEMLTTMTPQGPYPYAGIPWYSTTFGRDGLITAIQMLWCNPAMARGVLLRLATLQANTTDALADAQPGKILHEMRGGEMALLREIPFGLYYGTVDATPLFVMLAGMYAERTGDYEFLREIWPNVERALGWIDGPGDPDGDGFVEYHRSNEEGLINQGWKDSHDSVFHADGSLAAGPIALCEVQGYVYAAKSLAARCARRLGLEKQAKKLAEAAAALRERFERQFWCDDIGSYAIALDGRKQPCRVRTSNAGQVLFSGIASPEHAAIVAADMISPSFFSGWGIRTVAREERRYNPMSYHNGSIWPHDNALIASGMARYGHKAAVARVFRGIFDAASYMDLRRLPELFCGFQRGRGRGPTLYPVACSPQAWAAATPYLFLQALLGLEFVPETNEIIFRDPQLPPFLEHVTLCNLSIGQHTVDLSVTRDSRGMGLQVLRNYGDVKVSAVFS